MNIVKVIRSSLVAVASYASYSLVLFTAQMYFEWRYLLAILLFVTVIPLFTAFIVAIDALFSQQTFSVEQLLGTFFLELITFFPVAVLFHGFPRHLWNIPLNSLAFLSIITAPGVAAALFSRVFVSEHNRHIPPC